MNKIAEETALTEVPGFWDNPKTAEKLLKEIKKRKNWTDSFFALEASISDLSVMYDFYKSGDATEEEIDAQYSETVKKADDLEFRNMLSGKEDHLNAVLTINSGAGGTESCDWAAMLMRMYKMWAEKQGFKVKEDDIQEGETAGIRQCTLEIEGDYAFGHLKGENGVHRLVRISPFDANARRHTSFASIYVYPEIDDSIEIEVNPADIRTDTYRASGAGGQHINKTDSAVRLTHLPTGIVVQCQNDRSQHRNRAEAMTMLKSRLYEHEMQKRRVEQDKLEASKTDVGWGHQIRSYVLDQSRIKDLRTNVEISNTQKVLDGDLDAFIEASLKQGV